MNNLTKRDLDVLIEAIDHWPDRKEAANMAMELISAMVATTPEQKEEVTRAREQSADEATQQKRADENTAARIKVKLLDLRDALAIEEGKQILTEGR